LDYGRLFFQTLIHPTHRSAAAHGGVHLDRRLGVFVIMLLLLLGVGFSALTPNRLLDAPQPLPMALVTIGVWIGYGSLLHVFCKLIRGKGGYRETLGVTLRVMVVLFAFSQLAALILGLLTRNPMIDGKLSSFGEIPSILCAAPTMVGVLLHTLIMLIYLPLALRPVHRFGWRRQVLSSRRFPFY
jgi:hypothetical protein